MLCFYKSLFCTRRPEAHRNGPTGAHARGITTQDSAGKAADGRSSPLCSHLGLRLCGLSGGGFVF